MPSTKIKMSTSRKFQWLVALAFLCSLALGAITLYSFERFYTIFHTYKTFSEKEKVVITLSKNLLLRERLVHTYFQTSDTAVIESIGANHSTVIEGFNSLSNIALTTEQQELTEKNMGSYMSNVKTLEKLFTLSAELVVLQKQKLREEEHLVNVFQTIYRDSKNTATRTEVENLMNAILQISYTTNLHLLSHQPIAGVEKNLIDLQNALHVFIEAHPEILRDAPFLETNLHFYNGLVEEFNAQLNTYRIQYSDFNKNSLQRIESSLVDLELAFYNNGQDLYALWDKNNSYTWHIAIIIGLFTIVALSWLMVALSQLFSIKK